MAPGPCGVQCARGLLGLAGKLREPGPAPRPRGCVEAEAAALSRLSKANLVEAGMVDTAALGATLRDQSLEDLNDVEFSYTFGGPNQTALFSLQIADNTKPSEVGQYSCCPGELASFSPGYSFPSCNFPYDS